MTHMTIVTHRRAGTISRATVKTETEHGYRLTQTLLAKET